MVCITSLEVPVTSPRVQQKCDLFHWSRTKSKYESGSIESIHDALWRDISILFSIDNVPAQKFMIKDHFVAEDLMHKSLFFVHFQTQLKKIPASTSTYLLRVPSISGTKFLRDKG